MCTGLGRGAIEKSSNQGFGTIVRRSELFLRKWVRESLNSRYFRAAETSETCVGLSQAQGGCKGVGEGMS